MGNGRADGTMDRFRAFFKTEAAIVTFAGVHEPGARSQRASEPCPIFFHTFNLRPQTDIKPVLFPGLFKPLFYQAVIAFQTSIRCLTGKVGSMSANKRALFRYHHMNTQSGQFMARRKPCDAASYD